MSVISMNNIVKVYGKEIKTEALKGIDLEIQQGEMVAIMGPSGSGKSTLLNIIGCIDSPTSGSYFLNGESVDKLTKDQLASIRNKNIGFVFQSFNLLNDYDLIDNVTLPLVYDRQFKGSMKTAAINILDKVGLKDHAKKAPNELSGGQQQRTAIARALITNPDIILADEPTGSLDKNTGIEIIELLKEINKNGKTVVIITHDQNIANYCSRTIRIEDGKAIYR
ncbi:macrolide ABC transporter ATP-binding protein [Clostridium zeae]|uniref:Macrolide ABC transporter ATP-binding protein n=1 Tax=Clostridium zeae TaxID=2759022 RepID=A0ABQ1ED22_9CLOT|nr:ABC transporter ATP-binding protein [Clostridium zeae]GFZ32667.1 macrolide ABC transporter ATP-binding protein [Clostridium zeae]